jgi:aminopeptidase N
MRFSSWNKSARAAVLAFVLTISALPVTAQAPAFAPAPVAPPYQWPRSHDYDVQHYRIEVSFDWAKKSVAGETTVSLRPFKNDFKEFELDAGEMTINAVKLGEGQPLKFRYEGNEKLFIALDKPYAAGSDIAVKIDYSATPKKGLTFITPTENDPTRPYQIWSQGETQDNHYWFPCYDYPNDKATSELIARVEDKFNVISNGSLVSVKADAAKKTKTWHWKMDQPFSSYLVSIIVGEYAEVKDQYKNVPVSSYVYRDQVEEGRASFNKLAKMVALFSEKTGFEYPYPKYAQTMVRDFGGAMENITATTMTDTAVYDKRALLDVSADDIVSHELAHSWFGDMLTCRDWGELWLNESFATVMEAIWTEHDKGRDDYLYDIYSDQEVYFHSWSMGIRRPISTRRYPNPDSVFDAYAYQRGGAVLNMLRFVLGDEMFWKAINHYLKKHQYQTVETQDLVIAIEEATGQNLQWFFDEWIYKMGHPEFEIASSYDEGAHTLKLTVKQTQRPDDKRTWYDSPEFFTMPVDIAITTASGEKINRVWIDKAEKEFSFTVDSKPTIINFDRGNQIIKRVKFERSDEDIAYQLLHDNDVMGRVRAAIELKAQRTEVAARALTESVKRDGFWGVRIETTKALSAFGTATTRAGLLEAVKDKDARIRREAIKGLAAFKDEKLADVFISTIKNDPSYFTIAEAAKALGQTGSPRAFEVLADTLKLESWQGTVRAGAITGLAALKDARAIDIGLKYALPGNPPAVRGASIELLSQVGKGNDKAYELIVAALRDPSLQIRFAAVQALGMLGDARAIPALEALAKTGELPSFANNVIMFTITRIRSANKPEEKKD